MCSGTEEVITAWTRNPSCEQSPVGSNPTRCAIVVASFISLVATFFLSFYRKSPRTHYAAPPLPKKLTLSGDPDFFRSRTSYRS